MNTIYNRVVHTNRFLCFKKFYSRKNRIRTITLENEKYLIPGNDFVFYLLLLTFDILRTFAKQSLNVC